MGAERPEDEPALVSRVVVQGEVSRKRLASEIHSRIPPVLAQEKDRPIGAPGRVTYVVKRGTVTPTLHDGTLRVATTAHADIEVCKPLGPFCVGYGECHPSFVSTVDLPLALGEDYAWQQPSAGLQVSRGCRIAGFDVTNRLKSIAEANLGNLRNEVKSSLPELRPGLAQAWNLLTMPVYLNKDWCLRLAPRALVQGPATENAHSFQLSAALDTEAALRRDCQASEAKSELPPLVSADPLPETGHLKLSQLLTTEALQQQLAESLQGELESGEKVTRVEVSPVRVDERDVLLLGVTLDGVTCGTAWFRTTPVATSAERVSLKEVVPLAAQPATTLSALGAHIERRAAIKPEFSFGEVRNQLENLVGSLAAGLTDEVALTLEFRAPTPLPPDVTPSGLELWSDIELAAKAGLQ